MFGAWLLEWSLGTQRSIWLRAQEHGKDHILVLNSALPCPDLSRWVVEKGRLRVLVQGDPECGSQLELIQWDMQIFQPPNTSASQMVRFLSVWHAEASDRAQVSQIPISLCHLSRSGPLSTQAMVSVTP